MIGVFDSGVGGMTVARAIEQVLPEYRLVYFGDLARTPYGSKSPQAICRYSLENSEFLLKKGARIIVIACNSAASVATEEIRRHFPVPVFEVITPAVDAAVNGSISGRIGVIGTRATVGSGIYEQLIRARRGDAAVFSQPCPLLVPLVEEGWLQRRETKMILRRYLAPLRDHQVDTLVLGCTHYPILKELIRRRVGKKTAIVDSSAAVARAIRSHLDADPALAATLQRDGENCYYVSDVTPAASQIASMIFGRSVPLQKVD
ncbi:MAG: glutamate racemase [Thermodesulfobacteriota bacterium]